MIKKLRTFLFLLTLLSFSPSSVSAGGQKGKTLSPPSDAIDESMNLTVDKFINDTTNTHLYDPITLDNLRRLRDEAAPMINEDDMDVSETRRVVEKALAIQTGKSTIDVVKGSDMREAYYVFQNILKYVQDTFRYSVQNDGSRISVGKKGKGKKLVELNVEFSASQILEPQLRITNGFRLRYDRGVHAPMLEYRYTF